MLGDREDIPNVVIMITDEAGGDEQQLMGAAQQAKVGGLHCEDCNYHIRNGVVF